MGVTVRAGKAKTKPNSALIPSACTCELCTWQCTEDVQCEVRLQSSSPGLLGNIRRNCRQIFQRVDCEDIASEDETRLQYFNTAILPSILRAEQTHTLVLVRSYFEFVRLRNLLRAKGANFASISEYSSEKSAHCHGRHMGDTCA